jgi:hypothetical protein
MDNRGKLWTIDDDQKLMEQPELPNAYFAASMGRTENAQGNAVRVRGI